MVRIPSSKPVAPAPSPAAAPPAAKAAPAAPRPDTFTAPAGAASAVGASAPGPAAVADRFYEALARQDLAAVAGLYAPGATFHDPIFDLQGGDQATRMWTGLFKTAHLERMTHEAPVVRGNEVTVAWHADYTVNGNRVHNDAVATLQIQDGQIVAHRDDWDWGRWARQALSPAPGWLLSLGKPLLNAVIRARTM